MNTLTYLDYLAQRGIAAETAAAYRIAHLPPKGEYTRPAIKYPTVEYTDDTQMFRIKYTDGQKPKNVWMGKKPDGKFALYDPGALQVAIADANGVCWLLNGEPAVWAFHSFRIQRGGDPKRLAPATCLFGEGRGLSDPTMRKLLIDTLYAYGVKALHIILDTDEKGISSGYRLHLLAQQAGIPAGFYHLPFDTTKNNGRDFNDLWIAMGCEQERVVAALAEGKLTGDAVGDYFMQRLGDKRREIEADFAPPRQPVQHMFSEATWNDYLAQLTAAWEREFGYAGGYNSDGWSKKNVRNHWRGEQDASAGYNRNSGYMQDFGDDGYCFDAKALGQRLGVEWPFNGHTAPAAPKTRLNVAPAGEMPAVKTYGRLVSSREARQQVRRHMRGDVSDIGEPLPFPLQALHRMGGLCEVIPAGKLVGIAGGTGNGKTALNETMIDAYNQLGIDVIGYSPEWSPEEIEQRRIQRYCHIGGDGSPAVTYTALQSHYMALSDQRYNIQPEYRKGRLMTAEQQREAERVMTLLDGWHGELYNLYEDDPHAPPLYLETFLDRVCEKMEQNRANKRRSVVFIDYLQLADVKEREGDIHAVQQAMITIKRRAVACQFVAFITSQVTKQAQKDGELLTAADAQYLRADQFNLFFTINREYEEVIDNGVKRRKYLNAAKLFVDKNSVAAAQDYVRMPIQLARLRWIDEILE